MSNKPGAFTRFANAASQAAGSAPASIAAFAIVLMWAATGPLFGFSETWQLVINTGTTIITFLMVFIIQNSQNRDTRIVQLKLDELIRALAEAENKFVDLEDMSDNELEELHQKFMTLAHGAKEELEDRSKEEKKPRRSSPKAK